jgi:uncharacterized protein (DUF1778 family)
MQKAKIQETSTLPIRIPHDLRDLIRKASRREELTAQAWLRRIIRRAAKGVLRRLER